MELAARADRRCTDWELGVALLRHADGLPIADGVGPELDAVRSRRSLLDEADHVGPIVARLAAALRAELTAAHAALSQAIVDAYSMLDADSTWTRLDPARRSAIARLIGLEPPASLEIGTNEALLSTLRHRPLSSWREYLDAVPRRLARALEGAAASGQEGGAQPAPAIVAIRRGTLTDKDAVRAWVDEHNRKLLDAVECGPVIVT
jgi:hypothetical protein